MVEKEGKATQSFFPQADRDRLPDVVQPHLNLLRSSGDSSPHKTPRRPSTADSPRLTSSSLTAKSPHSSARPHFTSSDPDTGRNHTQRPSQHSRPPSPFKSSDRSSHSPDRSHTQSSSRRDSIDVSEGTNSPMHTTRDPKHKPTQAGQASPSHAQAEVTVTGINSQTPQRGSSSPSLPHGTKRKLSSDRNMPTPGGDDMDSQLIGPGVPSSSINISLEGPALKRRGSIAETRVGQTNIFDRRHSMDARPPSGGPQWWSGDRRDSSSSMFSSPPVSYGSPTYSADSSHGHQPGTAPFAWHPTQSPDQSSTIQSEGDGPSSGRSFDPSSVPPLAMVPPAPFSAERRPSLPTNLPSTMSTNSTVSRVLRSRSRPPSSGGRPRTIESAAADSAASQAAAESDGGGPASASSSTALPPSTSKDGGMTPYSRSPELRVSHKLAERKRRKEMKDLFDELRDQLPADRGMKASKWEILSKAIDFIMQLKQGHQEMTRDIDMLRHELESIRGGVPPFGPGGPHPGMYAPGPPSVVPYPPHPPTGHTMSPHQPPQVPNHQTAPPPPPPPPPQSDSRPGSSHNAFSASTAPHGGGGSGGTSGQKADSSST